jgi:hypothetical protein
VYFGSCHFKSIKIHKAFWKIKCWSASVFPNLLKNPISVFHFSFDILLQVAQPMGYQRKKLKTILFVKLIYVCCGSCTHNMAFPK